MDFFLNLGLSGFLIFPWSNPMRKAMGKSEPHHLGMVTGVDVLVWYHCLYQPKWQKRQGPGMDSWLVSHDGSVCMVYIYICMLTWLGYIDGKCYQIWHTYRSYGIQWMYHQCTIKEISSISPTTTFHGSLRIVLRGDAFHPQLRLVAWSGVAWRSCRKKVAENYRIWGPRLRWRVRTVALFQWRNKW